jgi:hypothetical protein
LAEVKVFHALIVEADEALADKPSQDGLRLGRASRVHRPSDAVEELLLGEV